MLIPELRSKSCDRLLVRYQQQHQQLLERRRGRNNNNNTLNNNSVASDKRHLPLVDNNKTLFGDSDSVGETAAEVEAASRAYSQEYFEQNSTLRRSRRIAEEQKRRSRQEAIYMGPFVSYARARVTCVPSPYDTEALKFRVRLNYSVHWRLHKNPNQSI